MKKLLELIKSLHAGRVELELQENKEQQLLAKLASDPLYAEYQAQRAQRMETAKVVSAQEADVRERAVSIYRETLVKKFPGVSIITSVQPVYEPEQAKEHCIQHHRSKFLRLDAKEFDKYVSGLLADPDTLKELGLDFVGSVEAPSARIDGKLDKAIGEMLAEQQYEQSLVVEEKKE